MEFFLGRLRFDYNEEKGELYIRVTGENELPGVEELLDNISILETEFILKGAIFESFQRKWKKGKRTDCIGIYLKTNKKEQIQPGSRTCCD